MFRDNEKTCANIVKACSLDEEGRIVVAGSIAEGLQTGKTLKETVTLANDVDITISEERFGISERSAMYEMALTLVGMGFYPAIGFNNDEGWWERKRTVSTEYGKVVLVGLEDLARSNISEVLDFIQSPERLGSDSYVLAKSLKRLLRQVPQIALFRNAGLRALEAGADLLATKGPYPWDKEDGLKIRREIGNLRGGRGDSF